MRLSDTNPPPPTLPFSPSHPPPPTLPLNFTCPPPASQNGVSCRCGTPPHVSPYYHHGYVIRRALPPNPFSRRHGHRRPPALSHVLPSTAVNRRRRRSFLHAGLRFKNSRPPAEYIRGNPSTGHRRAINSATAAAAAAAAGDATHIREKVNGSRNRSTHDAQKTATGKKKAK